MFEGFPESSWNCLATQLLFFSDSGKFCAPAGLSAACEADKSFSDCSLLPSSHRNIDEEVATCPGCIGKGQTWCIAGLAIAEFRIQFHASRQRRQVEQQMHVLQQLLQLMHFVCSRFLQMSRMSITRPVSQLNLIVWMERPTVLALLCLLPSKRQHNFPPKHPRIYQHRLAWLLHWWLLFGNPHIR